MIIRLLNEFPKSYCCKNVFLLFQTHPNVDKKLFVASSQVALKNPEKPFPMNQDVGVLKWRLQTQDEALIPLSSKAILDLN